MYRFTRGSYTGEATKRVFKVYRFHSNDVEALLPPAMKGMFKNTDTYEQRRQEYLKAVKESPGYARHLEEIHAAADRDDIDYKRSPFVSVTTAPKKLFESTEKWAAEIAQKAEKLSVFELPEDKLISPNNSVSDAEGEKLVLGPLDGMAVSTIDNPFRVGTDPAIAAETKGPKLAKPPGDSPEAF